MRYDLLLFLHISAAIVWIGSGFFGQVLASMAERRRDEATFAGLLRYNAELGLKLFVPASLATLVLGLLLVADGPWSFSQLWVTLGLVGFAATFLSGLLVLKPRGDRVAELVERDGGALGPEAMLEARKLLAFSRIDYVVLVAVVYDMAVKPTSDDTGALVVLVLGVIAGLALTLGRARRLDAAPAVS